MGRMLLIYMIAQHLMVANNKCGKLCDLELMAKSISYSDPFSSHILTFVSPSPLSSRNVKRALNPENLLSFLLMQAFSTELSLLDASPNVLRLSSSWIEA